jgi:hypothetical protein
MKRACLKSRAVKIVHKTAGAGAVRVAAAVGARAAPPAHDQRTLPRTPVCLQRAFACACACACVFPGCVCNATGNTHATTEPTTCYTRQRAAAAASTNQAQRGDDTMTPCQRRCRSDDAPAHTRSHPLTPAHTHAHARTTTQRALLQPCTLPPPPSISARSHPRLLAAVRRSTRPRAAAAPHSAPATRGWSCPA